MFLPITIGAIVTTALLLVVGSVYMHEGGAGVRRRALPIFLLTCVVVAIGVGMPLILQDSALIAPIAALTSLVSSGVAALQGWRASRSGDRAWVWWGLCLFLAALAVTTWMLYRPG